MVLASCFRCCRAPHVAIQVLLGGVAAVGGVRQTHHAHTSTHSSCLRQCDASLPTHPRAHPSTPTRAYMRSGASYGTRGGSGS